MKTTIGTGGSRVEVDCQLSMTGGGGRDLDWMSSVLLD